jgi:hypothetical protein
LEDDGRWFRNILHVVLKQRYDQRIGRFNSSLTPGERQQPTQNRREQRSRDDEPVDHATLSFASLHPSR